MPKRFSLLAALTIGLALSVSAFAQEAGQDVDAKAQASNRVQKFKLTLQATTHDKQEQIKDEQRTAIRKFFADLDSPEMKVEALGILHPWFGRVLVPSDMIVPLVEPLLDDADARVQAEALHALARQIDIGKLLLPKKLLELAGSEHPQVRRGATQAMAMSGHSMFATTLNGLMSDPNADVRQRAIKAWNLWCELNRLLVILPMTSDVDVKTASIAFESLYYNLPEAKPGSKKNCPISWYSAEDHIGRIKDHFRELGPEAQPRFDAGLEKAKIPVTFRQAVRGDK
jgi:hypothetical protein